MAGRAAVALLEELLDLATLHLQHLRKAVMAEAVQDLRLTMGLAVAAVLRL